MKRILVMALVMALGLGSATAVFSQLVEPNEKFQGQMAAAKNIPFEGEVLSHDMLIPVVVVKTAKGDLTLQCNYTRYDQEYNHMKGLKIGSKVKGEYKTVNHINYALTISNVK